MSPHPRVALFLALSLVGAVLASCSAEEGATCSFEPVAKELVLTDLRSSGPTFYEDKIYWTVPDGLYRANLDGSSPELLLELDSDPEEMFPGTPLVEGDTVFWAEPFTGQIRRFDIGTGNATTLVDGIASRYGPRQLRMDASSLYWMESGDGTVATMPRAGGDAKTWQLGADFSFGDPTGLRLHNGQLYAVSGYGRTIYRIDPATDDIDIVTEPADGFASGAFVVDERHVYYGATVVNSDDQFVGQLWRVGKNGTTPARLFDHDDRLFVLFEDAASVYHSSFDRIFRTSKASGETATVMDCVSYTSFLQFTGDWLYWLSRADETGGNQYDLWRIQW